MSGGGGTKAPETCGSFFDMLHEPRVLIGRLWLLTNLALFGFSFLAIAVAVANHHCQEGQTCDRSLGFAAVWTLIIALAMAIGGTKLLRSRTVCCAASARCLLPPPSPLLLPLLLLLLRLLVCRRRVCVVAEDRRNAAQQDGKHDPYTERLLDKRTVDPVPLQRDP